MLVRTAGLAALVLGVGLAVTSSVSAQPGAQDTLRKLDADLKKLRDQIKELEAKLNKSSGGEQKGERKPGFGKGFDPEKMKEMAELFKKKFGDAKKEAGKGGFDPAKMKEMAELFKKKFGDAKKEAGKGGPGGFGKGGFGKGGFGRGGFGKDFKKKDEPKKEAKKPGFEKKPFGGPDAPKMDKATIKAKYEFYKDLYEKSQQAEKKEAGKGGPGTGKGPGGFGKGPFGKGGFGKGPGAPTAPAKDSVEARLDRLTRELEALRNELKAPRKR